MYQDVLVIIINIVVAILGPLLYHFCWQAIPAELVALRSLGTSWGPVVDDVFLVQVSQCIMEMKLLVHLVLVNQHTRLSFKKPQCVLSNPTGSADYLGDWGFHHDPSPQWGEGESS